MRWAGLCGVVTIGLAAALPARAACQLLKIADLPVTMIGLRPTTTAKINGEDVRFLVDSGAFYSILSASRARELKLQTAPLRTTIVGVGGVADASVTTVKFTISGVTLPRVEFIVAGVEAGEGAGGLIGQNFLRLRDVEYDLAGGMIRLVQPKDCGGKDLAYWARTAPYSAMPIAWGDARSPHTIGTVSVNGVKIRAIFDTGAATSILSTRAASRVGVKLDAPGVMAAGYTTGIGSRTVRTWIAPVKSFAIGDEQVLTTRLRIGDIGSLDTDMLIGADFFLSHRVYVSNAQHRLFFTYNGGPVFNLDQKPEPSPAVTSPLGPSGAPQTETASANPSVDAEAFSRQGAALTSRRDYPAALSSLDRAVALAPGEPRYRVQRAQARVDARQPALAMADLDAAIAMKSDDVEARMMRAQIRLRGHDFDDARVDLDAVAASLSKMSDARLRLAELYAADAQNDVALAQYDLWLAAHADDGRRAMAFNGRCFARALLGRELDKALSDCDAALRIAPGVANVLDSRGLVRLRRGEWAKAIVDYDAALRANPRIAWSLYGRGVAKTRLGQTAEGAADIAAAAALAPELPARAKTLGVTP